MVHDAGSEAVLLPGSAVQHRMFLLHKLDPDSAAYNITISLSIDAGIAVDRLVTALEGVVARHEALRTTFRQLRDGDLVQRIDPEPRVEFEFCDVDLENTAAPGAPTRLRAFARRPFDLEAGPLVRCLVATGEDRQQVVISSHHSVCDGWSAGIVLREFRQLVEDPAARLPDVELQMADFAWWERAELASPAMAERVSSWADWLRGTPEVHALPLDRARGSAGPGASAATASTVHRARRDRIRALAGQLGCTEFAVYLGVAEIWLHKLTGHRRVAIGVPVANRPDARLFDTVGCFANTFAIPFDADRSTTVRECVAEVSRLLRSALAHQSVPFAHVVRRLAPDRAPRLRQESTPVFQVSLTYHDTSLDLAPIAGRQVRWLSPGGIPAKFDLALDLTPRDEALTVELRYDTALFEHGTAERFGRLLDEILDAALADPRGRIADIPAVTAAERARQLALAGPGPSEPAERRPLHELFEERVDHRPDAPAVVCGSETLTYAELDERANRLAWALRAMGAGPGGFVGVCLPRGAGLVAAMLGVLKTGAAYVPMDVGYPRERLEFMVKDSGVLAVVSLAGGPDFPVPVLRLDDPAEYAHVPAGRPARVGDDRDAAYVIYTSGSTGRPKGVVVQHGSCTGLFSGAASALGYGADETWASVHSQCFDFSVWEIFGPLVSGGRLVVCTPREARDPEELRAVLERHRVTVLSQTPSAFRALVNGTRGGTAALPDCVRLVVFGGEAFDVRLLGPWVGAAHAPRFANLYGITEATVHTTIRTVRPQERGPAGSGIGRPLPGTRVVVLDRDGGLVPVGAVGDLHIGGTGVARAYLGRPGLTAERFVPDGFFGTGGRLYRTGDLVRWRADGTLEFVGRADDQIKVRGFRVEPGEVESVLADCPGVSGAAVVARGDDPADRRLVAYVTGSSSVTAIRAWAEQRLPAYLVPSVLVPLGSLPLTANGKLDRAALPAPDRVRPALEQEYVAPRSEAERILARVLQDVLGLDRVGAHDNFFELGGDSMLSLRVASELDRRGARLAPAELLTGKDVSRLARAMTMSPRCPPPDPAATAPDPGSYPATPLQLAMLAAGADFYLDSMSFLVPGRLSEVDLTAVLDEVTARHPSLRTRFDLAHLPPLARTDRRSRADITVLAEPLPAEPGARGSFLEEFRAGEALRGFDVENGPLIRYFVHALPGEPRFALTLGVHHSVLDGWSVARLTDEIAARYAARLSPGAALDDEPPVHLMPRHAAAVRAAEQDGDTLCFWAEEAARAVLSEEGKAVDPAEFTFVEAVAGPAVLAGLTARATRLRCGLRTLFFASLVEAVAAVDRTDTVTVGTIVHGRPPVDGADRALGLFLNTLPITVQRGGPGLEAAVRACQSEYARCQPYKDLPFLRIRRIFGGAPRYTFNYTSFYSSKDVAGRRRLAATGFHEKTDLPMMISVSHSVSAGAARIRIASGTARAAADAPVLLARLVDELRTAAGLSGSQG